MSTVYLLLVPTCNPLYSLSVYIGTESKSNSNCQLIENVFFLSLPISSFILSHSLTQSFTEFFFFFLFISPLTSTPHVLHRLPVVPFRWLRVCYYVYLIGYRIGTVEPTSYNSITSLKSPSEHTNNRYFKVRPIDVYVIEGESAELKCQINTEVDAGPVQWAKDGFLLGKFLLKKSTHTYTQYTHTFSIIAKKYLPTIILHIFISTFSFP